MKAALVGVVAIAVTGCAREEEAPPVPLDAFPYAQAVADCSPWDGPAVTIFFSSDSMDVTNPVPPYVAVSLYAQPWEFAGRTAWWPGPEDMGTGGRCFDIDDCDMARAGEVEITAVDPGYALEGVLELIFGPGDRIAGVFRALWEPHESPCGG